MALEGEPPAPAGGGVAAARAVAAGAARRYAAGADDSWLDGDEIKALIGERPSGKRRRRK